jgi:hypothetical protein
MTFNSYDAADDTIVRAYGLLLGARPSAMRRRADGTRYKRQSTLLPEVRSDMRRLAIVMAVAALDTYMHRLIVERVYSHKSLPKGLAQLDVPFEQLLTQADDTADAARAAPRDSRPRVGVKRVLQERLLRETFQGHGDVSRALKMAGRSRDWRPIGEHMSPPLNPAEIKDRLDGIVRRRNQIVHEGDYERLQKPQKAKLNRISQSQARSDIDFVSQVIDAIHDVVS